MIQTDRARLERMRALMDTVDGRTEVYIELCEIHKTVGFLSVHEDELLARCLRYDLLPVVDNVVDFQEYRKRKTAS